MKTNKLFLLITVLISFFAATVLFSVASIGEKKWIAAVLLGLIAGFSFLPFIRNFKYTVFTLSVLAIPIKLDVFLYHKETDYFQLQGLPFALFDILFIFLLIAWVLQIVKKECDFKFYPGLSFPMLIAILFAGISVLISNDTTLSFIDFLLFIKSYIVFLYFANSLNEKKMIKWVLWIFLISVMMQSLIGIMQYLSRSSLGFGIIGESSSAVKSKITGTSTILSRVGGTIGSPNGLSIYLNFFLPVIFCSLFMSIDIWYKICAFITLMFGGLTEILTFSRGGWISLGIAIFFAAYIILKRKFKSSLKSFTLVTATGVFFMFMTIAVSSDMQKRIFEDDYKAIDSRLEMVKVAMNMIKENFFFGVGLNSYTMEMEQYDRTRTNVAYRFPYPVHNSFLYFTAECGIFAFISLIFLLGNVFYKSALFFTLKDNFYSLIGLGFFCGLLSFIIHIQVEPTNLSRNLGLWFTIAMIVAMRDKVISIGLIRNGRSDN